VALHQFLREVCRVLVQMQDNHCQLLHSYSASAPKTLHTSLKGWCRATHLHTGPALLTTHVTSAPPTPASPAAAVAPRSASAHGQAPASSCAGSASPPHAQRGAPHHLKLYWQGCTADWHYAAAAAAAERPAGPSARHVADVAGGCAAAAGLPAAAAAVLCL
jgi:hypothetical protein